MHFENGALLLFRALGINVYLHWLWVFAAYYEVEVLSSRYDSRVWNFIELLAVFGIILLHEFGHALACRQVGGQADRIILWPLGGLALIRPPKRPGAVLWSIAAGPLVNVFLVPVTIVAFLIANSAGLETTSPNVFLFIKSIMTINLVLLIFNILPFYPLDGGQVLQALLWFVIGHSRSILVASIIGLVGAAGMLLVALQMNEGHINWLVLVAGYLGLQAWSGIGRARAIASIERLPRHADAACPHCGAAPLKGDFWPCDFCRRPYDLFETRGVCPNCAARCPEVQCLDCTQVSPVVDWLPATVLPATTEDQQRIQALFNQAPASPESGGNGS